MYAHRSLVLVVVLSLLLGPVAPAAAAEDPRFVTTVSEPTIQPGETQTVTVTFENDAKEVDDEVEAVADIRATLLDEQTPFEVRSGTQFVGGLADGERKSATFTIVAPMQLEPGMYELPIDLRYEHDDERKHETVQATVKVPRQPLFAVEPIQTPVQPGRTETVSVSITHIGSETALGAAVSLKGGDAVTIGDGTARAFLGNVSPGETRTVRVEAHVAEGVSPGAQPIEATFEFRDAMGNERPPLTRTGSLTVGESQSFAVEAVSDTLRVGFDGTITGEIVNEGPKSIDDAVLEIEPQTDSVYIEDTRYALPSIDAGERATFEYPADVSGDADAGPRQVTFTLEYQDDDRTLRSSTMPARIEIDPYQDPFAIEAVETGLTVGESSTVTLQMTNQRAGTLKNIDALAYTDSPLEAPGDAAFEPALAPGESTEITFEITATSDARPTTYPIEVDFEYENPDGSTTVSDTFQVPVDVAEPETEEGINTQSLLIGAVIVLALIVGGILWWRS